MFVVVTEIFAVHFVPKGCVTRRPAVLRRGANINKWVEKILHKVNFCLWESAWHQGLKTSLSVYNANRIRPRRPPWPCLTGWPALGVNPGWKIGYLSIAYFYHLVHFFNLKSGLCNATYKLKVFRHFWSWDRTPPPSRPENGHLSKALLIKTASKPPTPWRWCVYWNTISQKCHCFQVLKNLMN